MRLRIGITLLWVLAGCGGRTDLGQDPGQGQNSSDAGAVEGPLSCASPRLRTLRETEDDAVSLVVDQDEKYLYWVTQGTAPSTGMLRRLDLQRNALAILAANQDSPRRVALSATHVYWVNHGGGEILRMLRSGGPREVVVSAEPGAHDLVLDEEYVTFTTYLERGAIKRAPLAGGAVELLAGEQATPTALVLDEAAVYWATTNGDIRALDRRGAGPPRTIASGQRGAQSMQAQGGWLYVSLLTDNAVRRVRISDGVVETLAEIRQPVGIVLDEKYLYAASFGTIDVRDGALLRVPLEGGPPRTLAMGLAKAIAVDASRSRIYLASRATHAPTPGADSSIGVIDKPCD